MAASPITHGRTNFRPTQLIAMPAPMDARLPSPCFGKLHLRQAAQPRRSLAEAPHPRPPRPPRPLSPEGGRAPLWCLFFWVLSANQRVDSADEYSGKVAFRTKGPVVCLAQAIGLVVIHKSVRWMPAKISRWAGASDSPNVARGRWRLTVGPQVQHHRSLA